MAFPLNLLAPSHFLSPPTPYLSSFHRLAISLSLSPAFYLYNYRSPFYLSPFLSLSVSLSYYYCTVSNTAAHLTSFFLTNLSVSCPCLFISLPLSFSLTPFLSFFSFLPITFIFFLTTSVSLGFFFICTSQSGGCSILFHTHPISPLEAAARCTLYWSQGTAYHFHYSQRAIENGVYSRRGARHALLGVSQAWTISNYAVWLNFLGLDGVSTLVQSDIRMKLFSPQSD